MKLKSAILCEEDLVAISQHTKLQHLEFQSDVMFSDISKLTSLTFFRSVNHRCAFGEWLGKIPLRHLHVPETTIKQEIIDRMNLLESLECCFPLVTIINSSKLRVLKVCNIFETLSMDLNVPNLEKFELERSNASTKVNLSSNALKEFNSYFPCLFNLDCPNLEKIYAPQGFTFNGEAQPNLTCAIAQLVRLCPKLKVLDTSTNRSPVELFSVLPNTLKKLRVEIPNHAGYKISLKDAGTLFERCPLLEEIRLNDFIESPVDFLKRYLPNMKNLKSISFLWHPSTQENEEIDEIKKSTKVKISTKSPKGVNFSEYNLFGDDE